MNLQQVKSAMADQYQDPQKLFKWMIAIVVATVVTMAWFSSNFVTVARGEEMMGKAQEADSELSEQITLLAGEVKMSNNLLMVHMDKERLGSIITEMRRNETEVFQIQQFVSVNGDNEQSRGRIRQLNAEHEDLELRKTCLINNNPLCD
jgi:hypothetical protein